MAQVFLFIQRPVNAAYRLATVSIREPDKLPLRSRAHQHHSWPSLAAFVSPADRGMTTPALLTTLTQPSTQSSAAPQLFLHVRNCSAPLPSCCKLEYIRASLIHSVSHAHEKVHAVEGQRCLCVLGTRTTILLAASGSLACMAAWLL